MALTLLAANRKKKNEMKKRGEESALSHKRTPLTTLILSSTVPVAKAFKQAIKAVHLGKK